MDENNKTIRTNVLDELKDVTQKGDTIRRAFVGKKNVSYRSEKKRNVVGFCLYHKGWLTRKTAEEHDCFNKKCLYLQKTENEYWNECE